MALNTDFKVKDSLYVGNSACFVTCTDTPHILSAGTELFDIFLQEGEVASNCVLSGGTAIASFSYDGSAVTEVAVDSTCNTTWNSAYTTTQSNSANWNAAYTWCTTNGDNVIDTVAEGNAQGRVAVTDIGNTTTQVDVNGLQTNDSPTFDNLSLTGNISASGTVNNIGDVPIVSGLVDGRDVALDGVTLDTLQSLSGDTTLTFSSTAQGELTVVDADGDTTCVDLGLQTDDNPTFAGATAGAVTVGVTNDNTINTTSGNLTINSSGGTTNVTDDLNVVGSITVSGTVDSRDIANDGTTLDTLQSLSAGGVVDVTASGTQGQVTVLSADGTSKGITLTNLCTTGTPTFNGVSLCGLSNVVDNTVLTINGSGTVGTDEVDSKIFGTELVDGEGTSGFLPVYSNGTGTIGDSIAHEVDGDLQIAGGLSATGTLSGDGSGLTGVTATPTFPTTGATNLASSDKIFVNDGASCETACNKHITYSNFIEDLAGGGLSANPSGAGDSLEIKNVANFTDQQVLKWDDSNGMFADSIIKETALGNITITGGLTVTDNLSVQGDLTCIDTIIQTTSAVEVCNAGTGPALYVEQTGAENVAVFCDSESGNAMTIYDGGNTGFGTVAAPSTLVGVAGTLSASGTVTAGGNLAVNGNTTLGDSSSDQVCINACGIIFCNSLGNVVDNTVLTMNSSGQVGSDEIDGKVWGTELVDGEGTSNTVPKYTNGTGTIGDSNITDSGSLVTIDSEARFGDGNSFSTYASNGTNYTQEATFSETVHTSGTNVPTFTKTNLKQVKYEVTLVNGVNVTSFEVNAVYNGTAPCGTTYAIVDAQAASQLADIEISSAGSTIDLDITTASNSTTAVIKGTALY